MDILEEIKELNKRIDIGAANPSHIERRDFLERQIRKSQRLPPVYETIMTKQCKNV